MFTLILMIHILVCALLIAIILIQQGRGGGLVDSFAGVESMFGTKTSTFLTRSTAILATSFIITCLLLAFLSAQRNKSVLEKVKKRAPASESKPDATVPTVPAPPVTGEQKTTPLPAKAEGVNSAVETAPVTAAPAQNQTAAP